MMPRLRPIAIGLALQAGAAAVAAAQDVDRSGEPGTDAPPAQAETIGGPVVARAVPRATRKPPSAARAASRAGSTKRGGAVARKPEQAASEPDAAVPAVALTSEQRRAIYRTVVREQQVPSPAAPRAPSARIIAGPLASGEVVTARPPVVDRTVPGEADTPRTAGTVSQVPATASHDAASYPVGAQLQPTVPLYAIPEHVALRMPQMRAYAYAVLDRRVLLVEPMTSRVVAEIDP